MTYGNGTVLSYEYDNLDRVVKVLYNGSVKYTYSYNGDGALYKVTEGTKEHYYNYDGIGRLVSLATYENGKLASYQANDYDAKSRTSRIAEKAGDNKVTNAYEYSDTNGLVTGMTQSYKAGVKSATNSFTYTYDHLKRASGITVNHDGTSYKVSYGYTNNLKDSTYTSNLISKKAYGTSVYETDAYRFDYVYDRVGNIKTATVASKYRKESFPHRFFN